MEKVLVIVGPTGVGKSNLAINLSLQLNGEIINADSLQVYKHLDIGTAKVTPKEQQGIPHHLIDIKELNEAYTVYDYQKDARNKIKEITARGKLPIIVGGTGLYIKAALYNYEFNPESTVEHDYEDINTDALYDQLLAIDPHTDIHPHNRKRIIRALNYYHHHQSIINAKPKSNQLLYQALIIGLTTERNNLYQIIDNRVDKMIASGLVKEVEELYRQNIRTKPVITGIGYKELYQYFNEKITLDQAIDQIKQNSRRYAKRQYTFFNNQFSVHWFDYQAPLKNIINYIKKEL